MPMATADEVTMPQEPQDIPPGRLLYSGPRPAAVARGRERLRQGPVPALILAEAMLRADALLRAQPADAPRCALGCPRIDLGWACGSVVASRCQSQAKRPT